MDIWRLERVGPSCGRRFTGFVAAPLLALGTLTLILAGGCASPGLPMPPSLKVPDEVKGLTAVRLGNEVDLHFTTPDRTTDGLTLEGPLTAEICREAGPGMPRSVSTQPCTAFMKLAVRPGFSTAKDVLPDALIAGAPRLLAYRVQLRNALGRTAGPSTAVFAASGPAPPPVEGFRVMTTKAGALLEWSSVTDSRDILQLDRVEVGTTPVQAGLAGSKKKPTVAQLRAGGDTGDPGGALDRTAVTGQTYRYNAQRIRMVTIDTHSLEIRSAPSIEVTVAMVDVFPPEAPAGLVSSPGFAVNSSAGQPKKSAIDLSWEPGNEAGIAGYQVYRRALDGGKAQPIRLNPGLVAAPAYRDTTVAPGQQYGYRVTAVDQAGNESKPSDEVKETAPGR